MKTNLLNLMSKVSILERDCSNLMYDLKTNCMNISIIELNGREEELENNSDFDDRLRRFMDMQEEVTKLKGIICDKNNELKLSNGKSIAQTLIELKNKRKMLYIMKELSHKNSTKERTTETKNSYFTNRQLAYDKAAMQQCYESLSEEIQALEFEISQLNSIMFEIDN